MRHFHCSLSRVSQEFVLEKMVSTTVFYPVSQHHRRKQSITKWKCVLPSCNHWEYWGGVEDSVLPECSVLWIKAVAVYSCVMVSLLRPSAVDNVINNILLSKQHLMEECCSSTLCMDTLLHWGIKGLLPFVPGLNPRSRSVYIYKPVLVCVHVREMMMSTSFSLGLL